MPEESKLETLEEPKQDTVNEIEQESEIGEDNLLEEGEILEDDEIEAGKNNQQAAKLKGKTKPLFSPDLLVQRKHPLIVYDKEKCAPRREPREIARSHSPARRRSAWSEGVLCKFFREACCRDGLDCVFSHDAALSNRKPLLCTFYREGMCKKGLACSLLHAEFPCKNFHKGTCNKIFCKYSHMPLNDFTRPIYDQLEKDDILAAGITVPETPKRRVLLQTPVLNDVWRKNSPSAVNQDAYSGDRWSASSTQTPQFIPMPAPQLTPISTPHFTPLTTPASSRGNLSGSQFRERLNEWNSPSQIARDSSSFTFGQQDFQPFAEVPSQTSASDLGTHSKPACQTVTCLSEAEIKSMAEKQIQMMDTIAQQEDGLTRPKFGFSDPVVSDDPGTFRSFLPGHVKERESSPTRSNSKRSHGSLSEREYHGADSEEKENESLGKRRRATIDL